MRSPNLLNISNIHNLKKRDYYLVLFDQVYVPYPSSNDCCHNLKPVGWESVCCVILSKATCHCGLLVCLFNIVVLVIEEICTEESGRSFCCIWCSSLMLCQQEEMFSLVIYLHFVFWYAATILELLQTSCVVFTYLKK